MSKNLRRMTRNSIPLIASVIAFAGCGGGNGSGAAAPPPPPPPTFNATFSEVQDNVFTPTCATSGCHRGAGAPQGLQLDEANSYGLLVGVASSEDPGVLRVAAGDPNNSYLIQKLEGTASVGGQMPLNGTPLEQSVIDIVRQWISDGAIDDRPASSNPIRVSSLSPSPGATLDTAPTSIVAMFDRELDVSTVNLNTFLLESSGGDGTFGDGNEQAIVATNITTPNTTPMSATFDLTGTTLADDTYRVTLAGTGASMIQDIDANALDGEFSGTFPSGDGTQGGDFVAAFEVSTPVSSATLDDIQAAVFDTNCSGCHSGPTSSNLPSGMDLSDANASFASLVGVASLQVGTLLRVEAGNPDDSYLVQKIEGTAAVGQRMPAGGNRLDQALIDDIREWITNGAAR
jgi:mono/diheme cytochrome c family protein